MNSGLGMVAVAMLSPPDNLIRKYIKIYTKRVLFGYNLFIFRNRLYRHLEFLNYVHAITFLLQLHVLKFVSGGG